MSLATAILGDSPVRIWGLSARQRIARQLQRAGASAPRDSVEQAAAEGGSVLLLQGQWVYDEPLMRALLQAQDGTVLFDESGIRPVAAKASAEQAPQAAAALQGSPAANWPQGWTSRTPATLASHYNNKLRKREAPYLLELSAATLRAVEQRTFAGSYKGVTDLVTKYVWPVPARYATKLCARVGLTPNQVTFASLLLTLLAFWEFWNGHFAVGLIAAWVMTFLDTVDGKLARVTLTSSTFGDILDHGIDLIHPPFWWWAWIVGLASVGLPLAQADWVLWVVVGGYVLQRLQEALFLQLFGIQIHVWRPFDSFFRLITARRNPNLLLLTLATLAGRPDLGMVAVAVWTVLCLLVHSLQIAQALVARRHAPVESWLSRA